MSRNNRIILIPIITAIICMFNHATNADEPLCVDEGSLDRDVLVKDWWMVAFASKIQNISVTCGRFSIHGNSDDMENRNKFDGVWTSITNSTSKEYIKISGELNNYVAVVQGLYVGGESERINIVMCNKNTEMIWKRSAPNSYLLLSTNPTGMEEVLNRYKLIAANASLSYQTVNNTVCLH